MHAKRNIDLLFNIISRINYQWGKMTTKANVGKIE